MNFDKLSSELDKLSLLQIEENDLNDPETWLFTPSSTDNKEKAAKEEENLEKWLKGAVEKVDFRTRSALSRRLEKKKRKANKEKKRTNMESSLSMIEEMSGESGPLSDREQQRRPRGEKENMASRKAISEAGLGLEDEDDDEKEDEDEYFDAPSTPKKLPLAGRNPAAQQSPRNAGRLRTNGGYEYGELPANSAYGSSSGSRNLMPATMLRNGKPMQKLTSKDEVEMPKEWRNLSDIERRAKEQERELQLEMMKARKDRLSANADRPGQSPRSRPNSASSTSSSVLSGGGGHGSNAPPASLATSKSVDFRTHADQSSTISSSRSNEGSLADLSGASSCEQQQNISGHPPNSRLPLPRRPTIPGRTGIPLPAPKRIALRLASANPSPPADPAPPMNDEECF